MNERIRLGLMGIIAGAVDKLPIPANIDEIVLTNEMEDFLGDMELFTYLEENQHIYAFFPHSSTWDALVSGNLSYQVFGDVETHQIKKTQYEHPLYGWIIRALVNDLIVVDNDNETVHNYQEVIQLSNDTLQQGNNLVVWPEGTRSAFEHNLDMYYYVNDNFTPEERVFENKEYRNFISDAMVFPYFVGASRRFSVPVLPVAVNIAWPSQVIIDAPVQYEQARGPRKMVQAVDLTFRMYSLLGL